MSASETIYGAAGLGNHLCGVGRLSSHSRVGAEMNPLLREPTVKLHRVIKEFGGESKAVAWGMNIDQAHQFARIARSRTKIRIERNPNNDGENYFEVATYRVEEDRHG